jgi:hypothetical protein
MDVDTSILEFETSLRGSSTPTVYDYFNPWVIVPARRKKVIFSWFGSRTVRTIIDREW